MDYFKHKTQEIKNKVVDGIREHSNIIDFEPRIIEIGLKEVARDIRHQLVDEFLYLKKFDSSLDFDVSKVENMIMNFEPKIKKRLNKNDD